MDKLTVSLVAALAALAGVAYHGSRKADLRPPIAQPNTSIDPNMVIRPSFRGDDAMVKRSPFQGDNSMVIPPERPEPGKTSSV